MKSALTEDIPLNFLSSELPRAVDCVERYMSAVQILKKIQDRYFQKNLEQMLCFKKEHMDTASKL